MLKKKNKQKHKSDDCLGRALINAQRKQNIGKRMVNNSLLHTAEMDGCENDTPNIFSVTEESSIQNFLSTAEFAEKQFEAEHSNIKIVKPNSIFESLSSEDESETERNPDLLRIPRRPIYTEGMSAEELHQNEKLNFLAWRRLLAEVEEKQSILLTPYEKNLELWRQLWRVVERSDILVQIVDARNPLFFYSVDLERYVKEVSSNKMNMILINKADLLTPSQRQQWATYFTSINVKAVFFSALLQTQDLCRETIQEEKQNVSDISHETDEQQFSTEGVRNLEQLKQDIEKLNANVEASAKALETLNISKKLTDTEDVINDENILSREDLLVLFRTLHKGPKVTENVTTVGLVGYPNVGKSSTINSLLFSKKVSVSATPGKTKHFQTFYLGEDDRKDLLLCDCPGLVMPSFVSTKAHMILNGILPIDNMKDHMTPIHLLLKIIPIHVFEDKYGIVLPQLGQESAITSEELLSSYAYNRGFMTANGQPDISRASRYILKDFINGKLLYCYAPPNIDQKTFNAFPLKQRRVPNTADLPLRMLRAVVPDKLKKLQWENQFRKTGAVHTKGDLSASVEVPATASKPWKIVNKHKNKNKKEKLRRIYGHLDQD